MTFSFRAPLLVFPSFGSPSARPGSLWGQGRLEFPHFMLSSSRVCGGRILSLPSCLPSATLKTGELLAKNLFLDFISFFLHFGRQDGFFSVYLEERLFSF